MKNLDVTLDTLDAITDPAHPAALAGLEQLIKKMLYFDAPSAFVQWLHGETQGDPTTVQHTLTQLIEAGLLYRESEAWALAPQEWETYTHSEYASSSSNTRQTTLPLLNNRLIGRKQDLRLLRDLLQRERLVSIIGQGGTGKSRLALQIAYEHLGQFEQGIYFVPLASVNTLAGIVSAIVEKLPMLLAGNDAPAEQLVTYLRTKRLLLVLDNYEHLLPSTDLIQELLTNAPDVSLLITSQETLKLYEESVYSLQGLPLEQDKDEHDGEEAILATSDAINLFLDSAARMAPSITIPQSDYEHIAEICRLVEGLPLAIELAAAWAAMLPCQAIVKELTSSLELLTSNVSNVPARHRSMWAACDYAWRRLDEEEQQLFAQMSVFRGSFDYRAAMEITGATLLQLRGLVDKSLLQVTDGHNLQMHPVMQRFGGEKLAGDGELKECVYQQHSQYYLKLLNAQEDALLGAGQVDALNLIENASGNLQISLEYFVKKQNSVNIDNGLYIFAKFLEVRCRFSDGLYIFEKYANMLKELPDVHHHLYEKIRTICCMFLQRLGQSSKVIDEIHTLFEIAQTTREFNWQIWCLRIFATALEGRGDHEKAHEIANEGLRLARENHNQYWAAEFLLLLGTYAYTNADYAQMQTYCEESLKIGQKTEDFHIQMKAYNALGAAFLTMRDYTQSEAYYQQTVTIAKSLGDRMHEAMGLVNLGVVAPYVSTIANAIQYQQAAYQIAREIGWLRQEAYSLNALGTSYRETGNYNTALDFFEQAHQVYTTIEYQVGEAFLHYNEGLTLAYIGDYVEADKKLQTALNIACSMKHYSLQNKIYAAQGLFLNRQNKGIKAIELGWKSVNIAKKINNQIDIARSSICLVYTLISLSRLEEAKNLVEDILGLKLISNTSYIRMEAITCFARIHLEEKNPQLALDHINKVLHDGKINNLSRAIDRFQMYLTYIDVLNAARDERADEIAKIALSELKRQSNFLTEEQREAFLKDIPVHRKILSLASSPRMRTSQDPHGVSDITFGPVAKSAEADGLLTRREHEILQLISNNYTNKQIASELVISPATVKRHVYNIYQKLEVKRRVQAVTRGQELGLL